MQLSTWALVDMAKYLALQNASMTHQTISGCSIQDLDHLEKLKSVWGCCCTVRAQCGAFPVFPEVLPSEEAHNKRSSGCS